jgi:hypothetical protein
MPLTDCDRSNDDSQRIHLGSRRRCVAKPGICPASTLATMTAFSAATVVKSVAAGTASAESCDSIVALRLLVAAVRVAFGEVLLSFCTFLMAPGSRNAS